MDYINFFIKGYKGQSFILVNHKPYIYVHEDCSDHQCEWHAVIDALNIIKMKEYTHAIIYTDSKLIYNQLIGKCHKRHLKDLFLIFNQLKNELNTVHIVFEYIEPKDNPARKYR